MITYINETNSSAYTVLFDKASEALKAMDENFTEDITSLEEYFAHIKELSSIDKKYTILPLDEEIFEINANTRQIIVPPNFKKNGVAVQGDQVAEIVYFKVDRFFDAMDLNETEIYIQWETAPDSKGVVNRGLSKEYVRDIESDPGNIIFGWPISAEITEHSGMVKFSVRFYKWLDANDKEKGLSYSLGTLNSAVLINQALVFDFLNTEIVDINDMIVDRLTNGEVVGGDPIKDPVYMLTLTSTQNLDPDTGELVLKVQAWSPDGGAISYEWRKVALDNSTNVALENEDVFEITADIEPNSQKLYYEKDDSRPLGYKLYNWAGVETEAERPVLYERFSACTVDSVGQYYAVATNTVGHKSESLESETCVVPMPVMPEFTTVLPERAILDDDDAPESEILTIEAVVSDEGAIHYEWYKDGAKLDGVIGAIAEFSEPGTYQVVAINALNKETVSTPNNAGGTCRISFKAKDPVFVNPTDVTQTLALGSVLEAPLMAQMSDHYSYQWYAKTMSAEIAIVGATNATYTPTEINNYFVRVINHVNGTESAPVDSNIFDVIRA